MANIATVIYSTGRHAKSRRARNKEQSWSEFVEDMTDYATEPGLGVVFTGSESKDEYAELKKSQPWIGAAFDKVRSNDTVLERSILFIDMDGVGNKDVRRVTRKLTDANITFFAHGTASDCHDLKDGMRAVRFLIPTNKPMAADEIWHCQHAFINQLGLTDAPGVDLTACQRARIMFVPPYGAECWSHDGKPARVSRLLNSGYEPPSESGNTTWSAEALAGASENSQAIAGWAFEMGLELMPSGRGWAIQCPNHMAHTDNDGTDGSTAILLPDALHPEVRFQCQHAHCKAHNSHQHLMLQLTGVPNHYLPEAHNISKKQLAELLPFADEDDIEVIHRQQCDAAAEGPDAYACHDEDLMDEPCALFTKRDPIIEGVINFKSTFELVGESNIGKSFFILGAMACASAGIPFAGQPVIKTHNFYFDAEGGGTTNDRKQALQITYGDPLDWLHIIDIQAEGWDLRSKAGQRSILRHIRSMAGSDPVGIIAFDSLNQSVALGDQGFDENSSSDMGAIASALKHIAEETGGTAGVVHHPAKAANGSTRRTGRGSGALHGAVDFMYFIDQPDETKPLQLNFYTEKARGCQKQQPRGFMLSKCKIVIEPGHNEAITSLQSQRPAPDFSAFLDGQTTKPFDTTPRDETLVLIPVALAPFESGAAASGREAVRQGASTAFNKTEAKVLEALEQLQEHDDRPAGYSAAEICRVIGGGGNRRPAIEALLERKIICYGKNVKGQLMDGGTGGSKQYRIPINDSDYSDDPQTASDEDLE